MGERGGRLGILYHKEWERTEGRVKALHTDRQSSVASMKVAGSTIFCKPLILKDLTDLDLLNREFRNRDRTALCVSERG